MPPPMLTGIGSDSEGEDEPGAGPAAGKDFMSQSGNFTASDFILSQSGTFKMADFQIRSEGGLTGITESPDNLHARPRELSYEIDTPQLDVQSISDLEMLDELGSGASGTVFKARHVSTDTLVAVKCVTILEKSKRDQVVSELRIMMSHTLGSRWLVKMHNAFYEEAKVYTVLELMDAGSVEDLVKEHAPQGGLKDEAELARIAREILNGLNYLHRQRHQVHRDLKPGNVMRNSKGATKIADFGISSQLESTGAFCQTFVGTTCYMSPERLAGEAYSYSADIWALGLILLELATGKYPYPKPDSYFQLLREILQKPAPSLPSGAFSADFHDVITLCLDKNPNLRPSAHDLLKHPWLREAEASARSGDSSRYDRSDKEMDRSRSNRGRDMAEMLDSMKLGSQ
ncbi:hypothetical protein AB1Y20_002507 [Prymnesium parvum]|uniref:mitogen-activated protein kinase kinase n=1 Tax=Prymnesium parvum TaxID=97485 RepID=A0AB34J962_PRYPA|mmetsp:Transcript_15281/g.38314  ORF Transcript_15281/g.38314 Transcript_15281/m.38314 type:complete len:401 (-) Transcript_15281:1011-2213(-)